MPVVGELFRATTLRNVSIAAAAIGNLFRTDRNVAPRARIWIKVLGPLR